jgi:WD40 repeat protein
MVLAVAFSHDNRYVATGSVDTDIRLWETTYGREVAVLSGHNSWVNGLAFSSDGETLASASSDGTVRLWDVGNRRTRAILNPNAGEVRSVAFNPEGSLVAAGTRYGVVKVWDSVGRQERATLRGHAGDVWSVGFAGDGRTLASVDGDWNQPGDIRLYDVETWREQKTLHHTGEVLGLAFAAKAPVLAAGSWDKTVKVWGKPDKPREAKLPAPKPAIGTELGPMPRVVKERE